MPTILIVDDDSAMREALDEAARDLGFDTRLAPSGASALAALDEGRSTPCCSTFACPAWMASRRCGGCARVGRPLR